MYRFKKEDFLIGDFDDVVYDNGLISTHGLYTSPVYETEAFDDLLLSWNSKTNLGFIEIEVRVKNQTWSQWISYGKWSDRGHNIGSFKQEKDGIAYIAIDEVKSHDCNAFQYRIKFSEHVSTVVSVSVSLVKEREIELYPIMNMDIEVPRISQMLIPDIGSIICSPTSLAMVMNYYGTNEEVIDTSQGCFDNGASIYGNWSYNVAYAGERGLDAYVMYCHKVKDLMQFIQHGIPIIASIRTKEGDLTGAPQAYPSGHLIVIRGFERSDKDYILVNDPASKLEAGVARKYDLKEFLSVWNQVIYVIQTERI